jgi:hypothetical protein
MNDTTELTQEQIEQIEAETRRRAMKDLDRFKDPEKGGWMVVEWSQWIRAWMKVARFHQPPDVDMMRAIERWGQRDGMNMAVVNAWNVWDDHPIQLFEIAEWYGRD